MTCEQISLRIGAVCVIFGSVIVFVSRTFLHGDLPTKTGEAALSYVASHPIYPLVHPGRCARCPPLGGPVALSGSLMHRVAWAIGRLGAASVLVGAAVHIVDFSIDGYALPTLADAWALTSPSERPDLGFGARLMLVAIGGPSTIALIVLRGSTIILYGLAVKKEGYSIWLGWTGVITGAVVAVLGTIQFLKPNIFPGAHGSRNYGPSFSALPCDVERVPRQTHATQTEMSKKK